MIMMEAMGPVLFGQIEVPVSALFEVLGSVPGVLWGWLSSLTVSTLVEWSGTLLGMAGAGLLSANCKLSRFGWVLFLISNVFWIVFGIMCGHEGFTVQQVFFMGTSSIGIFRWIVLPGLEKKAQTVT